MKLYAGDLVVSSVIFGLEPIGKIITIPIFTV